MLNEQNMLVFQTDYYSVAPVTLLVYSYRLQEGLRLVKAIKLLVLHDQEMSSIDDYSLQTDE